MLASVSLSPPAATPFRVGTTSHIYPGDWLANARRLAFRVRDLDLLCFDVQSLPDRNELDGLVEIRTQAGLSYTIHTPVLPELIEGSWLARRRAGSALRRIISHTRALEPAAYIVQLPGADGAPPGGIEHWQKRATAALRRVLASGIEPRRLCVLCHRATHARIAPVIESLDLSLALDISRWDEGDEAMRQALEQQLPRVRVIEWHGVDPDGRDHRSVTQFPTESARWLLTTLGRHAYQGVLTLKVLSEQDFEDSLQFVTTLLHELGEQPNLDTPTRNEPKP